MSPLLSHILSDNPRSHQPLLLLQSSTAQSSLPILQQFLHINSQSDDSTARTLLFCLLYSPSDLVSGSVIRRQNLEVYDLVENVPGYNANFSDPREVIASALKNVPSLAGPLNVVIDSVDTLCSDIGSASKTYKFLHELLLSMSQARQNRSRLVLHVLSLSQLTAQLIQSDFSPSLTHLTAYPPVLLTYLATAYLTPPPPASPPAKFWGVFIPISERAYESDQLVFGSRGEGSGGKEVVVDVLVRDGKVGSVKRRAVERVLEGWSMALGGACDLTALESLKGLWKRKSVNEPAPDPTQNVSFNLNLTPSQQESRAQVPLPYAHEGKLPNTHASNTPGAIFYDPDSADDIDDDDPDEDLDI